MPRRLFTLLSAVSMFLCAAVLVLWARSYTKVDRVVVSWSDDDGLYAATQCEAETMAGTLVLSRRHWRTTSGWYRDEQFIALGGARPLRRPEPTGVYPDRPMDVGSVLGQLKGWAGEQWRVGGFGAVEFRGANKFYGWRNNWLLVPLWSVCMLLAAGPAGWVVRRLWLRRRTRLGLTASARPAGTTSAPRRSGARSAGRRRTSGRCRADPHPERSRDRRTRAMCVPVPAGRRPNLRAVRHRPAVTAPPPLPRRSSSPAARRTRACGPTGCPSRPARSGTPARTPTRP